MIALVDLDRVAGARTSKKGAPLVNPVRKFPAVNKPIRK
jgi:hypothetical protein